MNNITDFLIFSNPWWADKDWYYTAKPRKKYIDKLIQNKDNDDIIAITGIRRIGKTTIFKLLIQEFIKNYHIDPVKILYVSLDHYVLIGKTIFDILTEYKQINKIGQSEKVWLFFDEVTYMPDYHQQLKNLYDMGNSKIFATASSATFFRDSKAFLTGRHKTFHIEPLDFWEFLEFNNVVIKPGNSHLFVSWFDDYLKYGGIPKYVLEKDPDFIKNLIDDVIQKDIIAYYNIKEKMKMKDLFRLLLERVGKQMNYNKISDIVGLTPETVRKFYGYFQDCFLFQGIHRYGPINEKIRNPIKIYIIDNALRNSTIGYKETGYLYENVIFSLLKNQNPCYFYQDGCEIDFIVNEIMIECKYKNDLSTCQEKIFDNSKMEKMLVNGFQGYLDIEKLVGAK